MIKSNIKPIYIYISKKTNMFTPDEYYIIHNLEDLNKCAIFNSNSGGFLINFSSSIAKDYLVDYELFNCRENNSQIIKDCFKLITFEELLDLIVDVSNEKYTGKIYVISLLQLVIAKWDEWY
jgi:hypothetical protein